MSVSPARNTSFRPASPTVNTGAPAGLAIIQIVLIVSLPILLQSSDGQRAVIALIIATLLFAFVSRSPRFGIPAMLVFVATMCGFRRWLIPVLGYTHTDPIILVAPVILVLNFVSLLIQRQIPRDSQVSKLVLWLIVVMAIEAANPLQGGLIVGFGGLLLTTVPILWFYLSRQTASHRLMSNFLSVGLVIIVLCAMYGLYQQFVGFLPSELQYISLSKYGQFLSNATVRVFSTFAGFADYAKACGCGTVLALAFALKKNKFAIFAFVFLLACVFLSSSRGVLATTLAASIVLWAVQGVSLRSWWPRLIIAAVIGLGGIAWSLKSVQSTGPSASQGVTSDLISHQAVLLDPLGAGSTGSGHVTLQLNALMSGIKHPFGMGTGAVTLAAAEFSDTGASAEGDFGNVFISLGLIGGAIFVTLVYMSFKEAFLNWRYFRDLNSLCCLGILLITFGQWLTGGDYFTVLIIWFCIGYIDFTGIERRQMTDLAGSSQPHGNGSPRNLRASRVLDSRVWSSSAQ